MKGFKKKLISSVLATTLVLSGVSFVGAPKETSAAEKVNTGYKLVWSDEFNGTSLNMNNWEYNIGNGGSNPGWGNNELEYYTDDEKNVNVSNGTLKITALEEKKEDTEPGETYRKYTSGRIVTAGKQSFQYGRMEARIKLPSLKGVWPAFWMLGADTPKGWPWCGEIDILEAWNTENFAQGAFHWNNGIGDNSVYDNKYLAFQLNAHTSKYSWYNKTQWHIYAVEWDNEYLHYFVDNTEFWKVDISTPQRKDEAMKRYYFVLNVAVGGNLPGVAPDDGTLPATMEVDYVRAYQRTSDNGSKSSTWTEQSQVPTYTVNIKNGSKVVASTKEYDGNTLDLPTIKKAKYVFKGWYTTDGKKVTATTRVRSNMTVVAKWTKVKVNKPTITSIKSNKSKTVMAKFKVKNGAKGYQIKYGRNSKLKKGKVTSTTSKRITIPFLKSGSTYYVKVRAYKLDSKKKKVYGKWSRIKLVIVK